MYQAKHQGWKEVRAHIKQQYWSDIVQSKGIQGFDSVLANVDLAERERGLSLGGRTIVDSVIDCWMTFLDHKDADPSSGNRTATNEERALAENAEMRRMVNYKKFVKSFFSGYWNVFA